jgi:hypothetical protein
MRGRVARGARSIPIRACISSPGGRQLVRIFLGWSYIGPVNSRVPSPLPGVEIDRPNWEGRMFVIALLKGYPNTAIIIFYVLASTIFALVMYRYHRSQIDLDH